MLLLLSAVACAPRPAAAQALPPAAADTVVQFRAPAESVATDTAAMLMALRAARARAAGQHLSKPRWVMLRSLVVPGWGQAYNHAWLKAGLVAASETALLYKVVQDEVDLRRLKRDVDRANATGDLAIQNQAITAYNDLVNSASTREYLLGLVVVYALMDAYVDAHFRNFKVEFQSDPALPNGMPSSGGGGSARLEWEYRF